MNVWHRESKMGVCYTYCFRSFCGKQYIKNVPTIRSYPSPFASTSLGITSHPMARCTGGPSPVSLIPPWCTLSSFPGFPCEWQSRLTSSDHLCTSSLNFKKRFCLKWFWNVLFNCPLGRFYIFILSSVLYLPKGTIFLKLLLKVYLSFLKKKNLPIWHLIFIFLCISSLLVR